jgi:hypothetical protein
MVLVELLPPSVNAEEEDRISTLERRELESGEGGLGAEGYASLLGLYLLRGQSAEAKFLWKRIPPGMKGQGGGGGQLSDLWGLAKTLFWGRRDVPAFYALAAAVQWGPELQPVVKLLVGEFVWSTESNFDN